MVESSPASLSIFLASLFMSSAQDSCRSCSSSSSRAHNKCLRQVKTIMLMRTLNDTVGKICFTFFEESGSVRCCGQKHLDSPCSSTLNLYFLSFTSLSAVRRGLSLQHRGEMTDDRQPERPRGEDREGDGRRHIRK